MAKIVKKEVKEVKKPKEEKEREVGKVFTYYSHVNVAGVNLTDTLNVGDTILIKGRTTNFKQTIDSIQVEHENVDSAGKGDSIGIKVKDRVRPNDTIYVVE